MKIQLIEEFTALSSYKNEWNSLVKRNETNTVFQLYEWHKSWWQIYGENGQLCTLLIFSEDKLVGIAPLMKIQYGMYGDLLQFIGEGRSDYCDFIIPENKKEIIIKIIKFLKIKYTSWKTIHINNVPDYSTTLKIVKNLCIENDYKYLFKGSVSCPTLILKDKEETNLLLNKKTLRRRYNYLIKNGSVKFFHFEQIKEAKKNLDLFFKQHIERTDLKNLKSLFLNQKNRLFYDSVINNMFPNNWVRFACLKYNEEPIAFHFGFEYNDRLFWYKPSFNIKYLKKSPGTIMLKYLIEYALNKNLSEFDFTVGEEDFKERFSNFSRNNIQIEIYNNNFVYIYSFLKMQLVKLLNTIKN